MAMSSIATTPLPEDIHSLKELLLSREKVIEETHRQVEDKNKKLEEKNKKIAFLEEYIRHLKHQRYNKSSERYEGDQQISLFNEAEQLDAETAIEEENQAEPHTESAQSSTSKRKPGRKRFPDAFPRYKVYHDIESHEKHCDCGCALEVFDEVTSEQLGIIPAEIYVIQHCRHKYRCPTCKDKAPVTAPLPPQPFPKSNASAELMAHVIVAKFLDGLPFYRQEKIWERLDVSLPRATLANWTIAAGELVQPLINVLKDYQHQSSVFHMDETPVQVLKEPDKPPDSKSYFWVTVSGPPNQPIYYFHYNPSRGSGVARDLLEGYRGTVISDDWSIYGRVCESLQLRHIACNDHARRKFDEALKSLPKKKKTSGISKPEMALNYYQKLYAIERRIKDLGPEEKQKIRQKESVPIWDKFIEWIEKHLNSVTPESKLGKALHYTYKLRDKLRYYCNDGHLPISNQVAENAIRPFAIARKNFLFFDTPKGATASANLYSLMMTAKSHGLNPFYYLAYVFKALPLANSLEDIEELLPWRLHNEQLKQGFPCVNRD